MARNTAEPALRQDLVTLALAYKAARGLSEVYVSKLAFKDQDVLKKLRAGKGSFTVRKYDEWVAWFEANWPKGVAFPPIHRISAPPRSNPRRR